jgi:hypothetical protein
MIRYKVKIEEEAEVEVKTNKSIAELQIMSVRTIIFS